MRRKTANKIMNICASKYYIFLLKLTPATTQQGIKEGTKINLKKL